MRSLFVALTLLLVGCSRSPNWEEHQVVRATLIPDPKTAPNPFFEDADEMTEIARRFPEGSEHHELGLGFLRDAESLRSEVGPHWGQFLAMIGDGDELYRCELLEDECYAIARGPRIVAWIWINGSNSRGRIGRIEYEK